MKCSKCGTENADDFYKCGEQRRTTNLCKSCSKKFIVERRAYYKYLSVVYKGGRCPCGYDKNYAAIEFHHSEGENKESTISELIQGLSNWDVIKKELDKCELLCCRCHREIHNPNKDIGNIKFEFDHEKNLKNGRRNSIKRQVRICKNCKKEFNPDRDGTVYCSDECFSIGKRKVKNRPTKNELEKLRKSNTWESIGKKYKVSKVAVIFWAKAYGIL